MPIHYSIPGIYIEETDMGPRPIQAVGTSTAGFVGVAPNGVEQDDAVLITNWSQFLRIFATNSRGQPVDRSTPLATAVFGFFDNGGQRCFVAPIAEGAPLSGSPGSSGGLWALEQHDEVAIVAAPGYVDPASYDALLSHCEKLGDRVAIIDAPEQVETLSQLSVVGTEEPESEGRRPRISDKGFGAYYYPWIVVRNPLDPSESITAPPSGHMAGIYARTDATRGVHKAPANEPIRGALSVVRRVSRNEQGALNEHGVNVLRFFTREGIRVWGGRTLASASSPWRYINVRRLINMVEESIAESTRWVVFEPNDATLWKSIRRDVSAFLLQLWRAGAFVGETPEKAFFVQCDEETNPPEVIDAGQVVTNIGVAPVKPAEFIIFRIGHQTSLSEG